MRTMVLLGLLACGGDKGSDSAAPSTSETDTDSDTDADTDSDADADSDSDSDSDSDTDSDTDTDTDPGTWTATEFGACVDLPCTLVEDREVSIFYEVRDMPPHVVFDAEGTPAVAYTSAGLGAHGKFSRGGTTGWSIETTPEDAYAIGMVARPDGTYLGVTYDSFGVERVLQWTPDGVWTERASGGRLDGSYAASIGTDAAGNLVSVARTTDGALAIGTWDGGWTYTDIATVTAPPRFGYAWVEGSDPPAAVYWVDEAPWTLRYAVPGAAPEALFAGPGALRQPELRALVHEGTVHVLAHHNDDPAPVVWHQRDPSGVWSQWRVFSEDPAAHEPCEDAPTYDGETCAFDIAESEVIGFVPSGPTVGAVYTTNHHTALLEGQCSSPRFCSWQWSSYDVEGFVRVAWVEDDRVVQADVWAGREVHGGTLAAGPDGTVGIALNVEHGPGALVHLLTLAP